MYCVSTFLRIINPYTRYIRITNPNGRMLPDDQRRVVEMRYYQDLSFREIADIENISINTALGRMRYALINMRKWAMKYNLVRDLEKVFE